MTARLAIAFLWSPQIYHSAVHLRAHRFKVRVYVKVTFRDATLFISMILQNVKGAALLTAN
jgi:hypothetical protein